MSDGERTPLHGRDHCPGGADPIPCLGTPQMALVQRTITAQTITAGFTKLATFETFATTDETVFATATHSAPTTPNNATGDTELIVLKPGLLIYQYAVFWDVGSVDTSTYPTLFTGWHVPLGLTGGHAYYDDGAITPGAPSAGQVWQGSERLIWVGPNDVPAYGELNVANATASDRQVTNMGWMFLWWPANATPHGVY